MKRFLFVTTALLISSFVFCQISDNDMNYLKGVREFQLGNNDAGKEYIEKYLNNTESINQNFTPYVYIGYYHYLNKDYEKSLEYFLKDLDYDNDRSTYSIGSLYSLMDNKEKALEYLEKNQKGMEAYPLSMIREDGDWMDLIDDPDFNAIMSKDHRPEFKKFVDSADYYIAQGDLNMALKMAEEAIKIDPENIKGYHAKGSICYDLQRMDDAEQAFRKEIELESAPDYKKAKRFLGHQSLGAILSIKEDYFMAVKYLQKAIKGNPTTYMSLIDIATFQLTEGNFDDAKKSIKQYIQIIDDDEIAYYLAGLIYLNAGDLETSKKYAQKAIDASKSHGVDVPQEFYDLRGE
jgi:tetratricopeptide (TPR) repeat protein